jgi:hypothetical protein
VSRSGTLLLALLALPPLRAACDHPPAELSRNAVAQGAPAPAISLADQQGKTWSLADRVQRGPVVLVFYRGDW